MTTLARVALIGALALALGLTAPARAVTTINVTSQQDGLAVDGNCTLREAIESANSGQQFDLCGPGAHADPLPADERLIVLPAGSYFLGLAGADEDANATGDLDINASLTIQGAGVGRTRVSANVIDRVFDIAPPARAPITVTLAGMTIEDGQPPPGGDGGGIRALRAELTLHGCDIANNRLTGVSAAPPDIASGAGIFFSGGELHVIDSVISNNRTSFGSGGGIYNDGVANGASVVNITRSTISNNRAEVTSGTGSAGGVNNLGGTLNILNSSIRDNFADGQAGGVLNFFAAAVANIANTTISGNSTNGSGGGIRNSGQMYLTHVTITNNTADVDAEAPNDGSGFAGGIRNQGTLQIKASIIFGNQDLANDGEADQYPDIYDSGTLSSAGFLMLGVITGTTTITDGLNGDLVGLDPQLGALSGAPAYFALPLGSPALNRIPAEACTFLSGAGNPLFAADAALSEDQAGSPRPDADSGRCDSGAHEPAYLRVALPLIWRP